MSAIRDLQERTSKSSHKHDPNHRAVISVRPMTPEFDNSKPPGPKTSEKSTTTSTISLPNDSIGSSTQVYAVWDDDDSLVYKV